MNKSTKKDSDPNPMAMFENMASMGGFDGEALGGLGEAGSAWLKGMAGVQEELASFVTTRLQHDADFGQSLSGCKNLQEAASLQQNWIREAVQEYTRASQTFTNLGTRMMTDYWSQLGAASRPDKNS